MISLYFRILRLKDKYEIDRRIFFKYYPFVYVHTFQACLGFIGDYCYQMHCTKSIVLDPEGPNKTMIIKYPSESIHNMNCSPLRTYCQDTVPKFLSFLYFKIYYIQLILIPLFF